MGEIQMENDRMRHVNYIQVLYAKTKKKKKKKSKMTFILTQPAKNT